MPSDTERDLLFRLTRNDEYAFKRLFNSYYARVYGFAVKYTQSPSLAEEIVNDVFVNIWQGRDHSDRIRNFSSYLFVVTRHAVSKTMKRNKPNYQTITLADEDAAAVQDNPCTRLIGKEWQLLLHQAVQRLPTRQQQVYELIKNEGLSRKEVALVLHLDTETVKFHLSQAMRNIRSFCVHHLKLWMGFSTFLQLLMID